MDSANSPEDAAETISQTLEAGRELLDNDTHTFWTKFVMRMGTVMSAMNGDSLNPVRGASLRIPC